MAFILNPSIVLLSVFLLLDITNERLPFPPHSKKRLGQSKDMNRLFSLHIPDTEASFAPTASVYASHGRGVAALPVMTNGVK